MKIENVTSYHLKRLFGYYHRYINVPEADIGFCNAADLTFTGSKGAGRIFCFVFRFYLEIKGNHSICFPGMGGRGPDSCLLSKFPSHKTRSFTKPSSKGHWNLPSDGIGIKLGKDYEMPPVLDNWRFLWQEENLRKIKPNRWKAPTVRVMKDSKNLRKASWHLRCPSWSW